MIIEEKNKIYMKLALEEAKKAYEIDEVPVGAIIVYKDEVIASGYNQRETKNNSLAHAEILAINQACNYLNSWRLIDCEMYVTLEPCCMCAMALIHARLQRIVFGASDLKTGACGSAFSLITDEKHNHRIEVTRGVLENECPTLISSFFTMRREQKRAQKELQKEQQENES